MKIKDRPEYNSKKKLLTYTQDTKVSEAVQAMTKNNFGSVVVVNDDKTVAGIVTERDIMMRLVNDGKDAKKTALSEIMSTDIRVAKEDDNLLEWLRIMSNERFRRLPIVDDNGKVVNIMTQGDFVSYTWPELLERLKENAKASFGAGYQIFFIVAALLVYALLINILV